MTMVTLSDSSIIDRNVQQCPFPYSHLMHELDPVHYDAKANLYLVMRHDLLIEAGGKRGFTEISMDPRG